MPNVNAVLNEQIRRLARREIKANIRTTRKSTGKSRRDIAALKREVARLSKLVASLKKNLPATSPIAAPEGEVQNKRLRVDGLKAHRAKLGLSAKDYGKLFGVSGLTIYNWEGGKSKPRRSLLPKLVAIRGMGKREAYERLGLGNSASEGESGGLTPRRSYGKYKQTAEATILGLLKKGKGLQTREMNEAWRKEGRAGTADVLLGKMVKAGTLKRVKVKGERGSRYTLA